MFAGFFGLTADPFGPGIGRKATFEGEQFRQLREDLRGTLDGREGISVLTGPEGVGKTTLLRALAEDLRLAGRGTVIPLGCGRSLRAGDLLRTIDPDGRLLAERRSRFVLLLDDAHRLNVAELGWLLDVLAPAPAGFRFPPRKPAEILAQARARAEGERTLATCASLTPAQLARTAQRGKCVKTDRAYLVATLAGTDGTSPPVAFNGPVGDILAALDGRARGSGDNGSVQGGSRGGAGSGGGAEGGEGGGGGQGSRWPLRRRGSWR